MSGQPKLKAEKKSAASTPQPESSDSTEFNITGNISESSNIVFLECDPAAISSSKDKCPCKASDQDSTYVICVKCKQGWHNRCCNLNGLTQAAIKKLDEWQCP